MVFRRLWERIYLVSWLGFLVLDVMKNKFLPVLVFIFSLFIAKPALADNPRRVKVTIKTSAECKFCKENIEESLKKVKGIRRVNVDFVKHEVYVVYNSKKITIEQIRKEMNDIGYDADGQKANFDKYKVSEHEVKK